LRQQQGQGLHLYAHISTGEKMTREEIIRMAREAGLFIAYDIEGHFSGVVDSEMIDMYPDRDKERDRLNREQRFVEILTPFAALVASAEREACANIAHQWSKREDDVGGYIEAAIRSRGQHD
jgi:hypothetical protein